jgi:maltose/moltooligosaccharide transporter
VKLDWKKTFLLGFGFLGTSLIWTLYNTYVPIYLQAGHPEFDANQAARTLGFGLGPAMTGFIMTLDNIAAFFIQPLVGMWSDRTHTRLGRRMPYIVGGAPIAVIAFALIPVAPMLIPEHLSGNLAELSGPFALFIGAAGVMLLAMAIFRTPVVALMPDITPSPLRSKANGVINLMGGLGGVLAFLAGGVLYKIYRPLPFWVGGALMLGAVVVLLIYIKEPKELVESAAASDESRGLRRLFEGLQGLPRESVRSLTFLILAIFFWFVGYNAIETFFSSYGVAVLGVSEDTAGLVFSVAYITFILFSIPSGYIATRFGRRRTILTGLVIFGLLLVAVYFLPNLYAAVVALALGGMAWSLVNINSLPMVVDISPSETVLGTYTGLYYVAGTLSAVVGPILNGWIIELADFNYNLIFMVAPAFFALAILCMLAVTRGEAKEMSKT